MYAVNLDLRKLIVAVMKLVCCLMFDVVNIKAGCAVVDTGSC